MKRVILFVLGLLLLPFLHAAQRPNILFIFTDDHAAHAISAYGSKINTTPCRDVTSRTRSRKPGSGDCAPAGSMITAA